jgi:hypothetical protein
MVAMEVEPMQLGRIRRRVATMLLACLFAGAAHASTVRQVSLGEVMDTAEFVFHGRVLAHAVEQRGGPAAIVTVARFEVLEVIKGPRGRNRVELEFAGGTLGGVTRSVDQVRIPAVGEEGVFFVEKLDARLVSPFVGWDQGHFVVTDDGTVSTADRRPVFAVERGATSASGERSRGVANGVRFAPSRSDSRPLSPERFIERLRQLRDQP